MAPIPMLYRATNEVTGEEIVGLASDIAHKLGTVQEVITTYALKDRKFQKQWSFSKEYEFVISDEKCKEWEDACKPFRELSEKKQKRKRKRVLK